ncbi:LysR family transcriptional regulator [Oscillibacter sp. MSJ-2]|uniref:LysR family transcriptional regulator n=1 Tax=Dysosmobacter acutus TaxID=2841504 RepID=A0ABS6FCP8_9FIRM|nr:LysR family transcriptional regulator [Dysosmobacter acutus]MBU5627114.1 LysR family transcriptional regulator [Dysosmobacter acutus]
MLSVEEVEFVLAIAKNRNITRAAEQLHVAQPALSRSLHALERRLGVSLFDRSTSPLSLTYAGSRYLSYARDYLSLVEQMKQEFANISLQKQGTLFFGVPSQIANYVMPKSVASFCKEHPGIHIEMRCGSTRQLSEMLREGKLHLSILSAPLSSDGFVNELIAYDKLFLVLSHTHPLVDKLHLLNSDDPPRIDLKLLEDEQFNITEAFYQSTVRQLFEAVGFAPSRITFVPNLNIAWELASNGIGVALIMQSMQRHRSISPSPIYCTIDAPELTMHFTLTYRESAYTASSALRLFVDHFRLLFSDQQI